MATASRPKSINTAPVFDNIESDVIDWNALNGALLYVCPKEVVKGVRTEHGTKDAIYADVLVIDGDHVGEEYRDTMVFPMTLVGQLKRRIGRTILVRLGQGKAQVDEETGEEYNAPWKFLPHNDEDRQIATDLLKSRNTLKRV